MDSAISPLTQAAPRADLLLRVSPDGWKAELVLLVHSEERASHLAEIIREWRTLNRAAPLLVRALSFQQAIAHLRGRVQLDESDPEIPIKLSELKLACSFVAEVIATFKAVRHFLRANPAVPEQGCPYPEYSPQFEGMIAFVEHVRGRLDTSR